MRRNDFFFPLESVYIIRERNFSVGSFVSQSSYSPGVKVGLTGLVFVELDFVTGSGDVGVFGGI
jgi:hypothetical protein